MKTRSEPCLLFIIGMLQGRSLAWKPLPLLSERNNTALATIVMQLSATANDSITISFLNHHDSSARE